jgi:hypothetical protein
MKNLLFTSVVLLFMTALIAQDKKPLPKDHCLGIKRKTGDSCKIVPKEGRYCKWHDDKAIHCARDKCGMIVARNGDFCIHHIPAKL